jgi:NitT/TauT family transport system substrate-binding protein
MKHIPIAASLLALAMSASATIAQDLTPVTIAYVPAVHFLPAFVSKENGCFAGKGIDATMTLIPIATNIPPALLSGSVQIGMSTASVILPAVENGLDLVAIAGASRMMKGNESISLVLQPEVTMNSAADLVGKKIGVPGLLSVGDLVFRKWLKDNGVNPDDVTYVEVPFPRMMEMMSSKTVDGVLPAEPAKSALINNNVGKLAPVEYYTAVAPDSLQTFWMSTGAWAAENGEIVANFKACLDEGKDWIAANPDEAKAIETQYLQVQTPVYPDWNTAITPADFALFAGLGLEFGLVTKDLDIEKLVYHP